MVKHANQKFALPPVLAGFSCGEITMVSDDDQYEYVYCRYRKCGSRLLDARAYGLKAWRLRIRRKKEK